MHLAVVGTRHETEVSVRLQRVIMTMLDLYGQLSGRFLIPR
jgi:hypothetical protein